MKLSVKSGRENKVHIHINGEYKLTVDAEFWYLSQWHNLKEIDEEQYEEMSEQVEKRRAFKNAFDLCMTRLHSKGEIVQKLSRKFSRIAAEYAAEKCEEIGVLNDRDFALLYSKELLNRKGMGISRIKLELRRKGIGSDIIEDVLSEIEVDETEQIKNLIERKYFRKISDEKGRRSVFNALIRLGYSYRDVKTAMREYACEDELM